MRLTITLERGDAALGTLDLEDLAARLSRQVEESYAYAIFGDMPAAYSREAPAEYGWEDGCHPPDFERSALATIRWLLRRYTIGPRTAQIPSSEELLEEAVVCWPRKETP